MRLLRTFAALLFLTGLSYSCSVDDINEDDALIKIEDVYATGGDGNSPPDGDKGGNGNG